VIEDIRPSGQPAQPGVIEEIRPSGEPVQPGVIEEINCSNIYCNFSVDDNTSVCVVFVVERRQNFVNLFILVI